LDFDDKAFNGPEVRSTYPFVPAIQVVQRPANPELSGLSTMWLTSAIHYRFGYNRPIE
jgi:hypothetical protein